MDVELATKGIAVLKRCKRECDHCASLMFVDAKCNCGAEQLNREIDETIQKLEEFIRANQS